MTITHAHNPAWRSALLALVLLLSAAGPALAKDYTLGDGNVHFSVRDAWPAIMEKTAGERQFYAFQIPNPQAEGTLTRITVTTQDLQAVTDFGTFVQQTMADARQSAGFQTIGAAAADGQRLHYSFQQGRQMQDVDLAVFQHGLQAVVVRCQHPRDAQAGDQWLRAYREGCADLVRQLGR